ncbi:hypothetical protein HPC49_34530 [Pyxidicoccus fallax]|uniref:Uncharacterized protein n=1 Tax=Pyxidicoccus fallax TaxID=394095 RepID=A0A848LUX2_9BACT|nr:hypothetical protein [Pyxidicoccus fallax]NPC83326.1 hypothetical protein [Pyxidicoccus fallax]
MRIQFQLPKERFTAAEERRARVTVRNEGTAPVEFPDPFRNADQSLTYTLTGPQYPEGLSVTWRSFYLRNPAYPLIQDEPPRIRLDSGQAIESTLNLFEWMPATRPGRYRLNARLTHDAFTATATPIEFDIVPSTASAASLGFDVDAPYPQHVSAVWLQEMSGQPLLMLSGHNDSDAEETGGVSSSAATVMGPVEPGSTDVMYPWSNDPQGDSPARWFVWRKGALLLALMDPATTQNPFRFDLGEPPERVVRPALQTVTGELFVPVVAAGGRSLRLIRFHSTFDATDITPGQEVGRVPLPGRPIAARATIQPASVGNGLSVLLVEQALGGLDVHHVRATTRGRLTRTASTLLRGMQALPQSEPGLWIDSAGRLNAALVVASVKDPRRPVLVELRYRPDGRLESPPRLKPLGALPVAARAAVVRYNTTFHRGGELTWAILLEDGTVLHQDTPRWHGPMKPRKPVAMPLELYISRDTYLLTVDPALGPTFEPLR